MPQDGSRIRSAASSPELSARSSVSISYRRLLRALASIGLQIARMFMLTLQRRPNGRKAMTQSKSVGRNATNVSLNDEIAHLRDLDLKGLRARWQSVYRRQAPSHLPRHLLFAVLAYQLQAEELGDLAPDTIRMLTQIGSGSTIETAVRLTAEFDRRRSNLKPGTILRREWKGRSHQVMVVDEGFAWNGKTYDSLSKIACAITGTKWNGPRFFGLRDQISAEGNT